MNDSGKVNYTLESRWWSHCWCPAVLLALHELMNSTRTKPGPAEKHKRISLLNFHNKTFQLQTPHANSRHSFLSSEGWEVQDQGTDRGRTGGILLFTFVWHLLCPHSGREIRQSSGSSQCVVLFCHPRDLTGPQRLNSLCHHTCVYVSICPLWGGKHDDEDDNTRIPWIISAIWQALCVIYTNGVMSDVQMLEEIGSAIPLCLYKSSSNINHYFFCLLCATACCSTFISPAYNLQYTRGKVAFLRD